VCLCETTAEKSTPVTSSLLGKPHCIAALAAGQVDRSTRREVDYSETRNWFGYLSDQIIAAVTLIHWWRSTGQAPAERLHATAEG